MNRQTVISRARARARKPAAWAVHTLTATGAAIGLVAIIAISNGNWMAAFGWMALTVFIDAVDGTFARFFKVKEVLPGFDGALLDNIVDYFTFVLIPAFFLYEAHIVPPGFALLAAMTITLASGYQFCQADAKTEDHYFKGFPSYWNIVVYYLFMLDWPPYLNLAIILLLAVAVFIPVKYLYPSRTRLLRKTTTVLTALWTAAVVIAYFAYPHAHAPWLYASLLYVVYYAVASIHITLKTRSS